MADEVPENPDEVGSEDKPIIRESHAEDLDNKATKGGRPYVDEDRVRELIEESAGAETPEDSLTIPPSPEVGGEDPSVIPEGEELPPPAPRDTTPLETPIDPPEIPDIPVPPLEHVPDLNITARFVGGDDIDASPSPTLTSTDIPDAPDAPDTPAPSRPEASPDVLYPQRVVEEDEVVPSEDFTEEPIPEAPPTETVIPRDEPETLPDIDIPTPPEAPTLDVGSLPEIAGAEDVEAAESVAGLEPLHDIDIPPFQNPIPYEQPAPLPEQADPPPAPVNQTAPVSQPFIPAGGEYEHMPDWVGRDAENLITGTEADKKAELDLWVEDLAAYISNKTLADVSGGKLPHPWAVWCGVDKNGILVVMATVETETDVFGGVLQTDFADIRTVIGSFTTSVESFGIAGDATTEIMVIPIYNGARGGGCASSCIEDDTDPDYLPPKDLSDWLYEGAEPYGDGWNLTTENGDTPDHPDNCGFKLMVMEHVYVSVSSIEGFDYGLGLWFRELTVDKCGKITNVSDRKDNVNNSDELPLTEYDYIWEDSDTITFATPDHTHEYTADGSGSSTEDTSTANEPDP